MHVFVSVMQNDINFSKYNASDMLFEMMMVQNNYLFFVVIGWQGWGTFPQDIVDTSIQEMISINNANLTQAADMVRKKQVDGGEL